MDDVEDWEIKGDQWEVKKCGGGFQDENDKLYFYMSLLLTIRCRLSKGPTVVSAPTRRVTWRNWIQGQTWQKTRLRNRFTKEGRRDLNLRSERTKDWTTVHSHVVVQGNLIRDWETRKTRKKTSQGWGFLRRPGLLGQARTGSILCCTHYRGSSFPRTLQFPCLLLQVPPVSSLSIPQSLVSTTTFLPVPGLQCPGKQGEYLRTEFLVIFWQVNVSRTC